MKHHQISSQDAFLDIFAEVWDLDHEAWRVLSRYEWLVYVLLM